MLLDKLKWRYATKKMDPNKPVPEDKVDAILEAIRLAPTSSGLQPFELLVITDLKLKQQIQKIAWNQSQVSEGSHLLVFAAWDDYTADRINAMFDLVNHERKLTNEGWEAYRNKLLKEYVGKDPKENFEHATRQVYIALGFGLTAAAYEDVDSTPMEGFDPQALDELLNLRKKGLKSVLIMPLGYRVEEEDWLAPLKKVRRSKQDLITYIKDWD